MFFRKLVYFLLIIFFLVLTVNYSVPMLTGSYRISASEIILIDSFRLQSKAYYHPGRKSGFKGYTFKSTNGYSFSLGDAIYDGISDKRSLADTLMYHDLPFIAYADKETFHKYNNMRRPHINLLQIQVGSLQYVDMVKVNTAKQIGLVLHALTAAFFLIFFARTKTRRKFFPTKSAVHAVVPGTANADQVLH